MRFFVVVFAVICLVCQSMPVFACLSISDIKTRNKEVVAYYQALRVKCSGNSCCLASVRRMQKNGFEEAEGGKCPEGVEKDALKCVNSLQWCRSDTMTMTDISCLDSTE